MILVVGATGAVGSEVVRLLRAAGQPVRALVREGADPFRVGRLRESGAGLVSGDLRDAASLRHACAGVTAVVSTATAIQPRLPGDAIDSVDRAGQIGLVEAAAAARAERFVYLSVAPLPVATPLEEAKRAVEERLQASGLAYTVVRPPCFMEVWLGPALGVDPAAGRARLLGSGTRPVSWVSLGDVARLLVASLDDARTANTVLPLATPEPCSPLEALRIFEEAGAPPFAVERIPEEALAAQYAAAGDPIARTFAGLMLAVSRGYTVDARATLALLPLPLTTLRDHARRVVSRP